MKTIFYATIAVALLLLGPSSSGQKPQQPVVRSNVGNHTPCGRFQLFQGVWGMPGTVEQNVLLRIDTESGKTWVYFVSGTGDQHKEGWIDVEEWLRHPNSPTPPGQ
jgi:hypothetical protein